MESLATCHGITCELDDFMGWANWCEGWADYQIDCTTTAVGEVIEEWESEQRLKWASSWKLEALAACHGVVCEGSNLISARNCTVAQPIGDS